MPVWGTLDDSFLHYKDGSEMPFLGGTRIGHAAARTSECQCVPTSTNEYLSVSPKWQVDSKRWR